jgi:hypothetical protein
VSELKSAYKALNREQQALIEDGRLSGARSVDEWVAFLEPVCEFDRMADSARLRGSGAGFFTRRYARKRDVPNGLRELVLPLLPILREDQDPAKPLELTLDLTGAEQDHKEVRKSDAYKTNRHFRVIDTFYDDTWLEGRARFVDGADVRFAVIDHMRSSKRWRRNARGKIKVKRKRKKKIELSVTLAAPRRNYALSGAEHMARGVKKASVTPQDDRTVVKLTRALDVNRIDASPAVDQVLELIAAAYERVDPARSKKL